MDVVFVALTLAVIGVVAALVAGRLDARLSPTTVSRPIVALPAHDITAPDIEALRFSLGLRGYRMDEVDAVLDQLATEISQLRHRVVEQDHQIATLRTSDLRRRMGAVDPTASSQATRGRGEHPPKGPSALPSKEPADE